MKNTSDVQSNDFPAQTQTDNNSDNKVCLYRAFQYQRYDALPGNDEQTERKL